MELKNIRIDSRLIHGQIATTWIKELNPNRLIVVDDTVVTDKVSKMALKMACPSQCKLSIIGVDKCIENMKIDKYADQRVFIIVKNPQTLLALYEGGFKFNEITVGNMASTKESRQIVKSISVTEQDVSSLKTLSNYGVKIMARMVPGEKAYNLIEKL
jgi:PTS system mannose-specific IIB component